MNLFVQFIPKSSVSLKQRCRFRNDAMIHVREIHDFFFSFFPSFIIFILSFDLDLKYLIRGKICRNLIYIQSNKFPKKNSRHFTPWIRREDDRTTYYFSFLSLKNLFSFDSRKYHDQIYHCFMGLDIFLLIFTLSFSELRPSFSFFLLAFFLFSSIGFFLYVFFFRFFLFVLFYFFFFFFFSF